MTDCENLATCAFFKEYDKNDNMRAALQGFVNIYCKGSRKDECIRMKVSRALGGPDKVPVNMKPDGKPIIGTSDAEWSPDVKGFLAGSQKE